MEAVILAAGRGTRLFPGSKAVPKGLLPVGETTILQYQVARCWENEIDPIHVVIGFRGDLVKKTLGENIDYVENPDFAETNSLYSYWLASSRLKGEVIVMNSDVLFHADILTALLQHKEKNVLAADFRDAFNDEDMKICVDEDNRLVEISKDVDTGRAMAENLGLVRLSESCTLRLGRELKPAIEQLRTQFFPYGLSLLAGTIDLHCMDVNGLPWIEIDFPEDYERARMDVYPRIVSCPAEQGSSTATLDLDAA